MLIEFDYEKFMLSGVFNTDVVITSQVDKDTHKTWPEMCKPLAPSTRERGV